ncbi:MAG: hypothetical protein K2Q23_04065 [Bryobacteraceae bacterium]|nr:hypothetical protein [Bryobacteraceae bacterium]
MIRFALALLPVLLFTGCEQLSIKKNAEQKKPDPAITAADEPLLLTDGSVRLFFRAPVAALDSITNVYGCCLASPANAGPKEIRVYQPAGEGLPMQASKKFSLAVADVVELYLERETEGAWVPYRELKYPLPQLLLHRRDFRPELASSQHPARTAFEKTGYHGWMIVTADVRSDAQLTQDAAFVKATGFQTEYTAFPKKTRLAKLIVKRADGKSESADIASSCTAVEICSPGQCLASLPKPCR